MEVMIGWWVGRALFIFTSLLLLLLLLPLRSRCVSLGKPTCRGEERAALLGFKNSFFSESYCSDLEDSDPKKMKSWRVKEGEAGGDCCEWGGVTCDEKDGHVIGLDLSSSCLRGIMDSKASIFDLVHLRELNLADNWFSMSLIPSAMGRLTRLTRLNLSFSGFRGQVIPVTTRLPKLSSLDLSDNREMVISSLEELLQNLTNIEELDLSLVKVLDGKVPKSLGNKTSLRSLVLSNCNLFGEFPNSVFELPSLEYIDVSENDGLVGRFASFHRGSPIKSLQLYETNFTGELPVWMGNLSYLTDIDISKCRFWGEIPSSIGHLKSLKSLDLGFNQFHGTIPPSIGNLTGLILLSFDKNRLSGDIPSSVGNLVQLQMLQVSGNQLKGEVPSSLVQLPQLFSLDLSSNMLTGIIPTQIGNLTLLASLDLSSNKLYGPLPISMYQLWSLQYLSLTSNNLTGAARFDLLNRVREVYLSSNAFSSIIFPEPGASLSQISSDLSQNHLQRIPPIQPYSISSFFIANNRISGEIPPSICEMWNIRILDLSDNNLTGVLPPCLGNLSSTLGALSLSGNNIAGKIPEFNSVKCELDTIDLSSNSFEGPLPRSFSICRKLKYVNFGSNKIMDSFPSWLGSLPSLKVLMLHSNKLYGEIKPPRNESMFPGLKVISLSDNLFWGKLPADYFPHWLAMKYFSPGDDGYPDAYVRIVKMTIINKGIEREFGKTTGYFTLLDLSSNNFSGTIVESIGDNLLKLHTLNLSNNHLTGLIPQSLANLRDLEVLDLSQNRLFGKIPGTLEQITSLAIFNVSYNNLTGSIPGENQFGTFDNNSYVGNPGLCGAPLTKSCGNSPQFTLRPGHDQEGLPFGFTWIATLAGLVGGLVVGVALEQAFGAAVLCWLVRNWRKYGRGTA